MIKLINAIRPDINNNGIKNGVIMDSFFKGDKAFILDKNNTLLAIYENYNNKSRVYKFN